MLQIKKVDPSQKDVLNAIVELHIETFKGFFLSSMHKGFLRTLYKSFAEHKSSELLVADEEGEPIGFIAYSWDTTGVYRYMLWRHFFPFVWYSFLSFIKRPCIFGKLFGALKMPSQSKRDEHYCKVFSLGVRSDRQGIGVGTALFDELKQKVDFSKYSYITLETDAKDNEMANTFYKNNGMTLSSVYVTPEGRVMNKYHYRVRPHEAPVS